MPSSIKLPWPYDAPQGIWLLLVAPGGRRGGTRTCSSIAGTGAPGGKLWLLCRAPRKAADASQCCSPVASPLTDTRCRCSYTEASPKSLKRSLTLGQTAPLGVTPRNIAAPSVLKDLGQPNATGVQRRLADAAKNTGAKLGSPSTRTCHTGRAARLLTARPISSQHSCCISAGIRSQNAGAEPCSAGNLESTWPPPSEAGSLPSYWGQIQPAPARAD